MSIDGMSLSAQVDNQLGHLTLGVKLCVKSLLSTHKLMCACVRVFACVLEILYKFITKSSILRPFYGYTVTNQLHIRKLFAFYVNEVVFIYFFLCK